MKSHLVLSGGGIYGLYMLGTLRELCKVFDFSHICGTSVGSILGVLICIATPEEIINVLSEGNLFPEEDIDFHTLYFDYGFIKPNYILKRIKQLIIEKTSLVDPTFREFVKFTKKSIYITGTNLTKQKGEIFSAIDSPDMKLLKAIEISISIPCIFAKVEYKDCVYVDGGVTNMYPVSVFSKVDKSKILSIELVPSRKHKKVDNFGLFLVSVMSASLKTKKNTSKLDKIEISCEHDVNLLNYKQSDIAIMIEHGSNKGQEFVKKIK